MTLRVADRLAPAAEDNSAPDLSNAPPPLADLDEFTLGVCREVDPFTLTSPERVASLVEAVRYIVGHYIPGAFVECGVWRGGSALAMLRTLLDLGVTDRDIWLYDTFEAMPPPTPRDVDMFGTAAAIGFEKYPEEGPPPGFEYLPFDEVRALLEKTGYPSERLHFIQGLVEDTIPGQAPEQISLLRLDTDWYDSTVHELEHLVPRVPDGGVLIIDDYGHWMGARDATDEYLSRTKMPLLLHRVDYTARLAIVRR